MNPVDILRQILTSESLEELAELESRVSELSRTSKGFTDRSKNYLMNKLQERLEKL